MTREQAKELLPIIQAFADGKTIQYKNEYGLWIEIDCPIWSKFCQYRIKPELKYRPFKNQEECWNEMLNHKPFGWLKSKANESSIFIGKVYKDKEVYIVCATNETVSYSASIIFDNYTFADGKPFGIKEEV